MNIIVHMFYLSHAIVEIYIDVILHFFLFAFLNDNSNTGELTSLNAFSKAIEKAANNPKVVEAIGVPIVRGPWYEASLQVGHRRRSVSCTFPVSGPHGSGSFQLEATRNGGQISVFSFAFFSCVHDIRR
jgi:hypothetical protein